ncbi:MAG: SPOR domain-containing protein [Gammaproteobacteria bacterium]|nr:SPOR domain-containing protein [Gammaproteobacteria bacterium]
MNDALKKRLTGAAVLLIVAGLLWPLLFDFDEAMRPPQVDVSVADLPSDMPDTMPGNRPGNRPGNGPDNLAKQGAGSGAVGEAPAANGAASTKPVPAATGEAGSETLTDRLSAEAEDLASLLKTTADAASSAVASQVTAASRSQPRLDQNKIPVAYVVQVATFNEWSNASKFKQTLLNKQLKAYIKPGTQAQPGPYRIAVGPVLTYAEAEDIVARIRSEHKIMDAIIRRLRDV